MGLGLTSDSSGQTSARHGRHSRAEKLDSFWPLFRRQTRHVDEPVPVLPQVIEALDAAEPHRVGLADVRQVLGLAHRDLGDLRVRERLTEDVTYDRRHEW